MGSFDRTPFLTYDDAQITQAFLDECAGNLVNQLEMIVDVEAVVKATFIRTDTNKITIYSEAHGITDQFGPVKIYLDNDLYIGTITSYSVDQFSVTLNYGISAMGGTISYLGFLRLSDRNKYVGNTFYEARLVFPTISRTIGDFLSPTLEFSSLTLEINNSDGRFNYLMPAGDDYGAWPGSRVIVKLGLRDVSSTYRSIFSGTVTHEGGFQRSLKSFTLTARNDFDKLNTATFPVNVFTQDVYPDLDPDRVNFPIPIIYGDWTVNVEKEIASIPAYVINGANPNVTGDESPNNENVKLVISDNALSFLDLTQIFVKRSDKFIAFDTNDIENVSPTLNYFEIRQANTVSPAVTQFDEETFKYKKGDEFFVKVKGKSLGPLTDNPVAQVKDIFATYGGIPESQFHPNWVTFAAKASPAQSAIATFKSRCWIQQDGSVLEYGLQLLEQFRLEAFIDNFGQLKINSLHFEDFSAASTFQVRNWDIEEATLKPQMDIRNNFNRCQGVFNFLPNRNENYQATKVLRNQKAIDAIGTQVSKRVLYPNIYDEATATAQLRETLKMVSSYPETIEMTLTWRAMLLDLGNYINMSVDIGSTVYTESPIMIRKLGYDPEGLKIPVEALSLQMMPFPGWEPNYPGITGGYNATITEE